MRLGIASKLALLSLAASVPPHRSRDESRPQCPGQQGGIRPGCWRRECRSSRCWPLSFPQCPGTASPRAASHTLRRFALRISVGALYLDSRGGACSRTASYPASPFSCAHTFGPSRPRSRRSSAHTPCWSLPGSWSLRSPSPCTVKAHQPPHARPPPEPTLRFAPGPLWFRDSKPGSRINVGTNLNENPRQTVQPLRF